MLRFLTVDQAGKRRLNSGILTDVRITADARANTLLVSAPAESMDLIEALIRQLDKLPGRGPDQGLHDRQRRRRAAWSRCCETLFGQQQQRAPSEPAVQTAAVEGESSLVPLRFAVDVRTNSIIASGSAGDLGVVEAILLRLDESDVRNRKSIVYRLEELLRAGRGHGDQRVPPQRAPGRDADAGALISPFEQIEREVVVVPEPVSNSLIVSATPRFFDEIKKLIEQLDERPPMVMIQVLIAEVTLNNIDEFGVELGLQDSLLFDRSLLGNLDHHDARPRSNRRPAGSSPSPNRSIQGADNTPGLQLQQPAAGQQRQRQVAGHAPARSARRASPTSASGASTANWATADWCSRPPARASACWSARCNECRRLDVLSRPQVMTLDNQPAFIQVGQRVPRHPRHRASTRPARPTRSCPKTSA